ncbi:Hypothetical protein R9X50_00156500 [Acrodontium crateriforme]|uniref:O-acyltransferase n=1 Tax=Acrodontium crateriforme TaxID=150365 RepID=A0AAQ3R8B2_9PEZI|nr:Hypothetical protein R9X50_00156500 [Acrodontium crateriforme]
MAASNPPDTATISQHAVTNGLHQPRARKPLGSSLAQALKSSSTNNTLTVSTDSPLPSGPGTPVPDDAPPSVKATSAARREVRRSAKQRLFPTIEYRDRLSYFDPNSDYSDFRGFFVLFWVGLAIMVITAMLRNLQDNGNLIYFKQWPLFTQNIWELAAIDFVMTASTVLALPLHILFKNSKGWLKWDRGGMIVQIIFQAAWLALWITWPFPREWSWTAQVYLTLHTLAIFMKMHSYAFYNGHLAVTLDRLRQLDLPIGPTTPRTAAVHYPSMHDFSKEVNPYDQITPSATKKAEDTEPIYQLREDLAKELTSPLGNTSYPRNLTVANFADYLLCPTLCYELEYPRTATRSYLELFYKTLAVFGCIFLMTLTSEEFVIPVLDESQARLLSATTWIERALIFAETVSHMLFPFMVIFLLVFLVIFEYVLGAFAEITRFADRRFYSDWWNSLDWLEFSREWNIPVHNFFRRHVYSASRGVAMSKAASTALTFFISALAHELVMGCITRKFRGYGFVLMMMQIPIVAIQRLPIIRERKLLNNVMFWISMIMGLSLLCALYVLV